MHPVLFQRISKKVKEFKVQCSGYSVLGSKSVKYLGLEIDQHVSCDLIAKSVISVVNSRIRFLYRQCNCSDLKLRKLICCALSSCQFHYCAPAWFNSVSAHYKKKWQVA